MRIATLAILAVAILAAVAGQAEAAFDGTFDGQVFTWFDTPTTTPQSVYSIDNDNKTNPLLWSILYSGEADDPAPDPKNESQNEYWMRGRSFTGIRSINDQTPPHDGQFVVADLRYWNGRTNIGTSPTEGPVNLDVVFIDPAGLTRSFSYTFDYQYVNNELPDPRDFLRFQSGTTFHVFDVEGTQYALELTGFSTDGGSTITDEFRLDEDAWTEAQLYGVFSGGGGEPPVAEPGALTLIGIALAGLARNRRK
jgi:hypothetical protein